jgi:hypothetical protein
MVYKSLVVLGSSLSMVRIPFRFDSHFFIFLFHSLMWFWYSLPGESHPFVHGMAWEQFAEKPIFPHEPDTFENGVSLRLFSLSFFSLSRLLIFLFFFFFFFFVSC